LERYSGLGERDSHDYRGTGFKVDWGCSKCVDNWLRQAMVLVEQCHILVQHIQLPACKAIILAVSTLEASRRYSTHEVLSLQPNHKGIFLLATKELSKKVARV
jgi:hypothetical protein